MSRSEEPMTPEQALRRMLDCIEAGDDALHVDEDGAVSVTGWGRLDADDVRGLLAELATLRAQHRAAVEALELAMDVMSDRGGDTKKIGRVYEIVALALTPASPDTAPVGEAITETDAAPECGPDTCAACGPSHHDDVMCIDSRQHAHYRRRRYRCNHCGARWSTREVRVSAPEVQAHAPASGERPVEADSTETGVTPCI